MNAEEEMNYQQRNAEEIENVDNVENGQEEQQKDEMIQLQGALVNKLIKRIFPDKIVTLDFKKEFSKLLSIFIFYVQNGQTKKKYGESDILTFLDQQGLGKVAQDLRNKRKTKNQQDIERKKSPQVLADIEDILPRAPIL